MLPLSSRRKEAQVKYTRDSNTYNSGRRRAASKKEAENNPRKLWYGEAGCLECPPKIHEHFTQKLLRDFHKITLLNTKNRKKSKEERQMS